MSSFNSTANLLLEHLGTMADGKTEVCMIDQFANAALDVICKVRSINSWKSKAIISDAADVSQPGNMKCLSCDKYVSCAAFLNLIGCLWNGHGHNWSKGQ